MLREDAQEDRGKGRVDAHRVLPRSGDSPTRASTGSSAALAEGNQEARPGSARPPREGSIGAPGADAGEVERLARRLEAVSQRMAYLLRQEGAGTVVGVRFPHEEGRATSASGSNQGQGSDTWLGADG